MLKQASVSDLITDRVSREDGHYVVIAMRRYPRFIRRELRDEYQPDLASDRDLFQDWLSTKRLIGDHNGAFERVHFEERFKLTPEGLATLARLSRESKTKDVYLVCQCARGQRCHREMLLLLAHKLFKARTERVTNSYPEFEMRLKKETAHLNRNKQR